MDVPAAQKNPRRTILIGLDGEMSGSELSAGHRLIQAGIAVRDGEQIRVFSSLIGWPDEQLIWDEEAYQIHYIERQRILDGPAPATVDQAAQTFLNAAVGEHKGLALVTVGFNVAAFDHPFFRAALPGLMGRMSRRAIDLNTVCFALDGWSGDRARDRSWQRWKKDACAWADEQMLAAGHTEGRHDAGYDAGQALYVLEFLRSQIHASSHPATGADSQTS